MEASTSSEANFQIPAISRIPLSVPSGYEVDLAISGFTSFLQSDTGSKVGSLPLISSLDGLGKLQSVEGMTIQKAFELMNRVKPIQDLVKRIVTKAEMWNVFINSNEVKEFERQLQTGANGPEAITSSNPQTQGISYSQHQSSGANIVVTNLSTNQQTHNNLSSQLRSSGANNVVRNPSISPQLHNTFYSQQQSSETLIDGLWISSPTVSIPNLISLDSYFSDFNHSGRPYGEASEKFTSELGIVTRQFAPQNVPSWTDISEEDKETLVAYLQEGFKFTNEPYAIESILNLMHDRYKSYRHDLRQRFRSFPTMESALADPPENMEKEAWKFLCEKWSDKDYKGSCFVVFQKYGGMLELLLILYEVWPECTDVPKTKFQIKVLQACVDLKLRSSLLDFECHFNEAIEKKMR